VALRPVGRELEVPGPLVGKDCLAEPSSLMNPWFENRGKRVTRVVDNLTIARETEAAIKGDLVRGESEINRGIRCSKFESPC